MSRGRCFVLHVAMHNSNYNLFSNLHVHLLRERALLESISVNSYPSLLKL